MMKVVVLGSINNDMLVEVDAMPAPGRLTFASSAARTPGGKGANQAVAAARLGNDVTLLGCVGDDDKADTLLENLKREGVDVSRVQVSQNVPTGYALIAMAETGHIGVALSGANDDVDSDYVAENAELIQSADLVLLSQEIPEDAVMCAAQLAHEAGVDCTYTATNGYDLPVGIADLCTVVVADQQSIPLLVGHRDLQRALRSMAGKLVVFLEDRGCAAANPGGEILSIQGCWDDAMDSTGAADEFAAALSHSLSHGQDLHVALGFANAAAALAAMDLGAQSGMPTIGEVEEEYAKNLS